MDFKERIPFGTTGLIVSRIGLASGYGVPAAAIEKVPVDFFHVRYNAVHTGAEQDVFPHLPEENRPGIVIYTATCWRKLLKPKLMPEGERPLAAADCYRFVLSHPDVNVCVTGPSNASQMEENLKAIEAGPLDEEEMARV
jgi:aryl-alcohol dehydrogenase-like predicted oxidoreductase